MKKIIFYLLLFSGLVFADTPPNPPPIFVAPLVQTGRNVNCNVASGSQPGCLSASDWTKFNSASGFPGGSNGSLQYNNSGVFGGFGSWNGTLLSIPGNFGVSGTTSLDGGDITTNGSGNMTIGGTLGITGLFTTHGGAAFNGNTGFFGTTPISKPTGSVLLGLANLGLINAPVLQSTDIPNNTANTTGTAFNITTTTNNTLTTLSALSLPATQITSQLPISHGGTGQATAQAALNALLPSQAGNSGLFLTTDGTNTSWYAVSGGLGTVTSVGLALPSSVFTVINSPVTTSGTITGSLNTQSANSIWAGPTSGSAAVPTFRALTAADIPSLSYVSSVSGTSPIISSGGSTPAISITQATTSTSGYLSSTDWNTFNGKQTALTFNTPLSVTSNTVSISQAGASSNGYLSSADWNTFNGKGSGSVTSVTVTPPSSIITSSGNPIVSSGTITESLVTQSANTLWAGPTTGSAAAPTFRAIVPADVPTLNQNTTGTASNITSTSNSTLTTLSNLTLPGSQVSGSISGNAANVTGTVAIANGGTGQTTANTSLNALLPSQASNTGFFLQTDGTNTSWEAVASGGITSVTATAPVVSSGGSNPNITCNVASGSQPGCLASADWTTFNGKQTALTFGNLSSTGTAGLSFTGGTNAVVGSGTTISQTQSSGSSNGFLSSTDWTTFNNKINSIPIANTVFVNTAGNDTTCVIARIDLPCATVGQAMQLIGAQTYESLISIQNAGTFSVDGMTYYPNVFIGGPSQFVTTLDFGNAGITMDASWNSGTNTGGINNVALLSSGTISGLTFDFSSYPLGDDTFDFTNVQLPGTLPLNLYSSNSGNETTFNIDTMVANKGSLTFQDATGLVFGYFNQNDGLTLTSTGSNDSIVYVTNSSYFGAVNLTGAPSAGRAILLMISGSIFGTVALNNSTSLLQAQMGTLPAASSITNSGGTLDYGGDAVQVPYFPSSPSSWPSPAPSQVSQALDTLVSNSANTALSNLVNPTSINQDLIFNEGTNAQILTANSSTGPTANLNMKTGDGTGQASGSFSIGAGNSDTQSGGVVDFSGGNVTTATANESNGGDVSIFGGNTASTNASAEGGSIMLAAGNAPIATNSGGISIYDGNNAAGVNIGPNVGVNILDDAGIQGAEFFSTDRELDNASGAPIINFASNLVFSVASPAAIQWQDGTQGTSGQCIVSTDTNGTGQWGSCGSGGGGANTTLSNLGTTSINSILLPNANQTLDFGSSTLFWNNGYFYQLNDANGVGSVGAAYRELTDDTGSGSVAWGNRYLIDASGFLSAQWDAGFRYLIASDGTTPSIQWGDPANVIIGPTLEIQNDLILIDGALNIKTIDSSTSTTSPLNIQSGNGTSGQSTNNVTLTTGNTDTGSTGNTNISTGNATAGTGGTGAINLEPGESFNGAGGTVFLEGGTSHGANNGGEVQLVGGSGDTQGTNGAVTVTSYNTSIFIAPGTTGITLSDDNGVLSGNFGSTDREIDFSDGNTAINFTNPNTIEIVGQIYNSQGAYASPSPSSCGTSPTLTGGGSAAASDTSGVVTAGSGVFTSCVISFGSTWLNTPHCFVNYQGAISVLQAIPTTTTLTINSTGAIIPGSEIDYYCIGNQ